jgi:hypothetical protein
MGCRCGVRFPAGAKDFSRIKTYRLALGPTQPPVQWFPRVLPLGVKQPRREAVHSPLSSADVKNEWSYTSTPHGMDRDNFICYFGAGIV